MTATALSMTGNERIKPGGNMSPFDVAIEEINTLYAEAKNWADGTDIENAEQHDAAKAVYDALHEAGKKADALRVEEKRPLDEQIKEIQDRFNPYIQPKNGKVDLGKSALNDVLAKWRKKVADEKAAKAAEARREAEQRERDAQAAMEASKGDLEAREQADELDRLRKESAKAAARAEKDATKGLGLRTVWSATLTSPRDAVAHYWKVNPEAFLGLIQELADKDVRAGKREIPGFDVTSEKKAI